MRGRHDAAIRLIDAALGWEETGVEETCLVRDCPDTGTGFIQLRIGDGIGGGIVRDVYIPS